ncbi:DUF559 domain-containing protein [Actinoplanes sp. GCM10030250]|uniref:DUF559 domain-containing protein n=1 Tax=Actinoplanes sp. GCM10030250 TaxID=3273376 RepID=UPI003621577B
MPASCDPRLRELLEYQDGVISRTQAIRHLSRRTIEHRLDSGQWQSPHHGVYVAHSGPIGTAERLWIAVLGTVGGHTVWLGGLSALRAAGFRGFLTEPVHILMPARLTAKRPPGGVVVHRTTHLPDSDLRITGRPPRTVPARSLIDAAQWQQSERRAAAIIMAGFQQRLVRVGDMLPVLAAMPRLRHRALIAETIADAAGGAGSLPEAEFLRLCRTAALPEPRLQFCRPDSRGRTNYLDAYFPDQRVHVEIDGSFHVDVRQWWADMSRQNRLWLPGDRVLRFPAWAIRHDPDEVIAQLQAALSPV